MAKMLSAAHERVRVYRAKMKQQGLRQISIWVPDTKSPKFRQECRRQSRLASAADRSVQLDVDKVLTLPREKIGKRVGHLGNTLMIRVGRALSVWLGMS
jgi:hypothetical protein